MNVAKQYKVKASKHVTFDRDSKEAKQMDCILWQLSVMIHTQVIGTLTIWQKSCDISDGDTRAVIEREADDLIKALAV